MQYDIIGGAFPVVVCNLQAGEGMKCERGAMSWMDPCMQMQTQGGGFGKMFGKAITGEGLFHNQYVASAPGKIAFGSSFPGKIIPVQVTPGTDFIVQKSGFLACEPGVELSVHINKRIGGAFFGGEGFIMQKLSGNGMAFIECDGECAQYELAAGQQLIVDTGCVLAVTGGVSIDIQTVKGLKNIAFGGEGLFNTVLTGPGTVWLQTMPLASFVSTIARYMPSGN